MFEHLGITKSDVEILFNLLLTASNFYWIVKFNSVRVNDQILRTLKDENEEQEREIKKLQHQILVVKIKSRREKSLEGPVSCIMTGDVV